MIILEVILIRGWEFKLLTKVTPPFHFKNVPKYTGIKNSI